MGKKWLPLESNPEVMADFAHTLGLPADVGFHDIFGFDPDLLAMVPKPVHAVLLLFPITDKSEKAKDEEGAKIKAEGQTCSDKVYYMKQTIGNACGTIGILHAVGNNLGNFDLKEGSYFKEYFAKTAGMTPVEKAAFLEADDGIEAAHGSAVAAGETRCPELDEQINLHFVALVHVDETLLQDAVPVIQTFIENSEGSLSFNAIAMAPGGGEL